MDLHVRGGAGPERPLSVRRAPSARPPQPNRLLPLRVEPAATPLTTSTVVSRATSGAFAYDHGPLSLTGESEAGPDGQAQVRGNVAFRQGRLELTGDGVFRFTQSARNKLLVGEGGFVWRDRIGGLLSGQGTLVMRADRAGNMILQLAGALQTRRRSFVLDGPGEAEVDVRSSGAYVMRLKGRTTIGRGVASLEGDIELEYGEADDGPIDAVTVRGRARTEIDGLLSYGEGGFVQQGGYGPATAQMTVRGSGTYRHGALTCHGAIALSIRFDGQHEVVSGSISGTGGFDDGTLAVDGLVEGRFLHGGAYDEFDGEVRGTVQTDRRSGQEPRQGILTLTLEKGEAKLALAFADESRLSPLETGDGPITATQ